jgi:hypothetical protein
MRCCQRLRKFVGVLADIFDKGGRRGLESGAHASSARRSLERAEVLEKLFREATSSACIVCSRQKPNTW